jgi:hypothetical protein
MTELDRPTLTTAPRASRYAILVDWLMRPRAHHVIMLLGFVLLLPSLSTGLAWDDYLHTIMLDRPNPIPAFGRAPLDIFRFCDPSKFAALLSEGVFNWWDDPNTKLAFLRPLTAVTHVIDHALWRNQGAPMHLHSALWALLLFAGVSTLYRALLPDRLVANLALALYALDDARGWLVSWVAARNAAVATAISIWTLVAHHFERSGRLRTRGLVGPLLLAAALLAGEGSIATCGYIVGYSLFLEKGPWLARALRLWPYGVVLVVWRVVYRVLDYGAFGSTMYVDPQNAPLRFLKMLLENGPILLGAQLGGMWSDVWNVLFIVPVIKAVVYLATLACVGWVLWLLVPMTRRSPALQFMTFGALLAVVPASSVFPADRLLTWVGIGASCMLACLIAPLLRGELAPRRAITRTATVLLTLHAIGVVMLPSRARGNLVMRDPSDRTESGIPRDPGVTAKTLIFVNPPFLPFAAYVPLERAALGIPRPHSQHILGIGTTEMQFDRIDEHSFRLHPRDGFLLDPVSKLLWTPEHRPFSVGQQITQGDLTVTLLQVTPDHRPLEVEMRFVRPLEDPRYVWRVWEGTRPVPFTPPRVGESAVLAGADYFQAVFGMKFPIEARL